MEHARNSFAPIYILVVSIPNASLQFFCNVSLNIIVLIKNCPTKANRVQHLDLVWGQSVIFVVIPNEMRR